LSPPTLKNHNPAELEPEHWGFTAADMGKTFHLAEAPEVRLAAAAFRVAVPICTSARGAHPLSVSGFAGECNYVVPDRCLASARVPLQPRIIFATKAAAL
jgi:hypothetical protein